MRKKVVQIESLVALIKLENKNKFKATILHSLAHNSSPSPKKAKLPQTSPGTGVFSLTSSSPTGQDMAYKPPTPGPAQISLGYEIESLHPSSLSSFSIRLTVSPSR